jgi:hypothetical protein
MNVKHNDECAMIAYGRSLKSVRMLRDRNRTGRFVTRQKKKRAAPAVGLTELWYMFENSAKSTRDYV